ncbi:MAG: hypothetical protein ABFC63_08495 [Thermoguttaceae bacterium]
MANRLSRRSYSAVLLLGAWCFCGWSIALGEDVSIVVDAAKTTNVMRGGIGASWHAIEEPIPYSDKPNHPIFKSLSHGGSAWGGYPPAEDETAWRQIDRHARWLGLDWNRVELEQRIYEPERGRFEFDNPEMRILYRILDWCQKNEADVFLQQMWANVRWNTCPEWRDDPIARVHAGPASVDDFAGGLATLLEHLIKKKRYTCIRWLCISNEPNGWWRTYPDRALPMRPALAAVRKALDAKGVAIPLSGPDVVACVPPLRADMTESVPVLQPRKFDYFDLLGAYDFHTYDETLDWLHQQNSMAWFDKTTADWAAWAHGQGKPLFLSEVGTMANGWGADHPGPGSYESAFKDAELIVRRINAGADGFNRWSFINRGDLDGQWQFIETWDRKAKKLLTDYTPHANTYFLPGLLSRFVAKHSSTLSCTVNGGRMDDCQRVFAAALRSPTGQWTLAVVNHAPVDYRMVVDVRGLKAPMTLYRYGVQETDRDRADLKIHPQQAFKIASDSPFQDRLAPMSLTIYSTYQLAHDAPGVMAQ